MTVEALTIQTPDCQSFQTAPTRLGRAGIDAETIQHFGIGYNRGPGSMGGRIVIYDENGLLVAYAGRTIDRTSPSIASVAVPKIPRTVQSPSRCRSREEYCGRRGFFRLLQSPPCWPALRGGLDLMGCSLSFRQEELLQEHVQEVVLFWDGDKAGRNAAMMIANRLVSKVWTRLVETPTGNQPHELSADQIRCLCVSGYF